MSDDGKRYAFSTDGEEFDGTFKSRAEAIAEAIAEAGHGVPIWVGEIFFARDIIRKLGGYDERVVENMEDELSNHMTADVQIIELSPEDGETLNRLIVEFVADHAHFNRYGVTDVQKYTPGNEADE